ncbi:MAG: 2-C-methyl-D-erythritol 2,4-cyclodiphosphate synthase [Candidatus Aminicenantes bacterium 4484_214]|nr:MAG: 2-C-methyl-D-erythritol 2,4-cyclodiphosphate synthase [Candidatus Aminicenantes bacterium 4484_214]RLE08774.1 MAG: 2-C-methyl-D-erythritol 2,4-cyclodiphosphate synthase [Candidatus Aminicenantes bacterium]
MRIGLGYDLHRLQEGRELWLGGVKIPFEAGLLGHSDGDCLLHALIDALLGALGEGDIGQHFPDDDPRWAGVSSVKLLEEILALFQERHGKIINIDVVIIAERPRLQPYFPQLKLKLAGLLGIPPQRLNLKAKTSEGLGLIGGGQAMAAWVIALVELPNK